MNARSLARWRLRGHGLGDARFGTPEEVVRWLGAVQSQEYALAKWSVGMRCGAGEATLDGALARGTILRTHVLRPTWHFVLPEDICWMLALTGDRVRAAQAPNDRRLGLDDALFVRSDAVIARVLEGGRHRTRAELGAALAEAGIVAEGNRLAHIVLHAELRGIVCSGAPRGKQQTHALLSERAPAARRLARDEALFELAARYFTSHGPATLRDFRWWSGLRAGEAAGALASLGARARTFTLDGRAYHHIEAAPRGLSRATRSAHLLQGYDEYIVAYTESRDVVDVAGLATNLRATRPPFTHAVALDGQVIGHWRRRPRAASVEVEVKLAGTSSPGTRRALEAAAARYGRFTGVATTVI